MGKVIQFPGTQLRPATEVPGEGLLPGFHETIDFMTEAHANAEQWSCYWVHYDPNETVTKVERESDWNQTLFDPGAVSLFIEEEDSEGNYPSQYAAAIGDWEGDHVKILMAFKEPLDEKFMEALGRGLLRIGFM